MKITNRLIDRLHLRRKAVRHFPIGSVSLSHGPQLSHMVTRPPIVGDAVVAVDSIRETLLGKRHFDTANDITSTEVKALTQALKPMNVVGMRRAYGRFEAHPAPKA